MDLENKSPILLDHRLIFPYGISICGRMFAQTGVVLFRHGMTTDGAVTLNIDELTAKDEKGVVTDLKYITDDLTTPMANHIILCILGNERWWDWRPAKGEEPVWW